MPQTTGQCNNEESVVLCSLRLQKLSGYIRWRNTKRPRVHHVYNRGFLSALIASDFTPKCLANLEGWKNFRTTFFSQHHKLQDVQKFFWLVFATSPWVSAISQNKVQSDKKTSK